jgi:signal peptidase I
MTTTRRRVLRVASGAVTILLIGVAVFALAEYATGTQPFYVVTDSPSSMSPTLNHGDLAVIYRAPFSSIGPGSIIAFHDPLGGPGILLHRVVSVLDCGGSACLVTKGDNNATNPTRDPWNVTASDYIGEVVLVAPYLGYLSPALWGFSGLSALLPISAIGLAVVLLSVMQYKPTRHEMESGS